MREMRFVQLRVPVDEKETWHEAARRTDLRLAQFIRRAVRSEIAGMARTNPHEGVDRDA